MKTPLLVIVGETASGKSSLAVELSTKLNGEIINADSWITRKYLDIGTAKPTREDQKKIKHYLVDIAEPDEDFTVAEFKPMAEKAIEDVSKANKLPIMVGGSGLYIDSVLFNYSFLEGGDREKRKVLNSKTIAELLNMIEDLKIDIPDYIDRNNKRRLIRLIEVGGRIPSKDQLREHTLIIGIKQDSEMRRLNIEKRVDQMVNNGLEREVKFLVEKYGWDLDALKGIGYRQWKNYLEGGQSLDETKAQIVNATINLAKKQMTWFKRNKSIQWFDAPVKTANVVAFVTTKFSSGRFN
jgi:tRNA dimethylallyltransferase